MDMVLHSVIAVGTDLGLDEGKQFVVGGFGQGVRAGPPDRPASDSSRARARALADGSSAG
ncbi:hypothetical protein AB0L71_23095 [Streptomyces sp. NPDC052052]|uniref:hypothetical protein n=1 Tax=Streptomyces sp. NPDC052052 TaxID=3154756 RepID=UPI003439F2C1